MGQGKLYCRLVKPFSTFCWTTAKNDNDNAANGNEDYFPDDDFTDADFDLPEVIPSKSSVSTAPSRSGISTMPIIDDHNYAQPSTSPENSNTPVESRPTRSNSDLQFLINELLDNQSKKPNDALSFNNLKSALTFLNSKLGEEKFRLRVQPSFALEDAFSYLKGNDFDPTHVLVTTFKGQPAIDTGGVLRQVGSVGLERQYNGFFLLVFFTSRNLLHKPCESW